MALIEKIFDAKKLVKESKHKKEGKNSFSNYEYFTPGQIEQIVFETCEKLNLITKFDLIRDQFGITGCLVIIDVETGEREIYQMATAMPEIKATNEAQQLGGCMTYTERYLKMTAFGITDNNLDPDTSENTQKRESAKHEEDNRPWLSEKAFNQAIDRIQQGEKDLIQKTIDAFKMKKEYKNELLKLK